MIPERFAGGALTPCAYIRLLQPLDHPAIGGDFDIVLADAEEALNYRADIIVTQRYAVPDLDAADALIRHCREHGIALLYDLDDDLRHVPRDHPDARLLRPQARVVSRLVRGADAVWVSTPALAATWRNCAMTCTWWRTVSTSGCGPPRRRRQRRARDLCASCSWAPQRTTPTSPSWRARWRGWLRCSPSMCRSICSGSAAGRDLPSWVNRIGMPVHATASYPGFVNWITQQHWDIGIAPLADTPFNRCKSAVKTLDYAALGLPVLASESRGVSRHAGRRSCRAAVAG